MSCRPPRWGDGRRPEGAIALEALLTRLPGLRLDGTAPQWQRSLDFRALTRLDVAFAPLSDEHDRGPRDLPADGPPRGLSHGTHVGECPARTAPGGVAGS